MTLPKFASSYPREAALFTLLMIALSIVIFKLADINLPYERDLPVKAGKVMYMVEHGTTLDPISGPIFYREHFFSMYYLISAATYQFFDHVEIFRFLNFQAAIFGIVTMLLLCLIGRNAYGIRLVDGFVVFSSMPILIITSSYGNESIFASAFFLISMVLFRANSKARLAASVLFFALALLCRPDVALLFPFWIVFLLINDGYHKKPIKDIALLVLAVGSSVAMAIVLYWLLVLGFDHSDPPQLETSFEFNTNYKLLAAFLLYPFNPSVVALGGLGFLVSFRSQPRVAALSLLLIPLLFYFGHLSTPKYVWSFCMLYGFPAGVLLSRVTKSHIRYLLYASILLWYFVSISPFGIKANEAGSLYAMPTGDGPIPTGAYISSYQRISSGFYQAPRKDDLEIADHLYQYQALDGECAPYLRFFGLAYRYSMVVHENYRVNYDYQGSYLPIWEDLEAVNRCIVLPRRDYLYINVYPVKSRELILDWLRKGQVKGVMGTGPFPTVIEIGDALAEGSNTELAERILFVFEHLDGYESVHLNEFIDEYRATSWLPRDLAVDQDVAPVYADSEYVAFDRPVVGGSIWSLKMPLPYYHESEPFDMIQSGSK